jgi:hypothetical protein
MRNGAILLLAGFLSCNPLAACDQVQACIGKWGTGRRIQAELIGGGTVIGRIGTINTDGFDLQPDKRGGATRAFKYAELRSVNTKLSVKSKWLIAGTVYGVLVVIGVILGG